MTHKPRLSKTKSLLALQNAADRLPETAVVPCRVTPKAYQDLPDDLLYSPEELDRLCGGCPLFQVCQDYGRADRGATGVWGGIQHMNDRLESGSRKREVV